VQRALDFVSSPALPRNQGAGLVWWGLPALDGAAVAGLELERLPVARQTRLTDTVTIDLDATDGEVYGRRKRGVAYT
jgi:hypothetical protein